MEGLPRPSDPELDPPYFIASEEAESRSFRRRSASGGPSSSRQSSRTSRLSRSAHDHAGPSGRRSPNRLYPSSTWASQSSSQQLRGQILEEADEHAIVDSPVDFTFDGRTVTDEGTPGPDDYAKSPDGLRSESANGRRIHTPMSFEDSSHSDSMFSVDPPDNSPFEQVRASVPATDDISVSIHTPRMWTLSIVFAILGSSTNLFFSLRYPSVTLTPVVALLVVHPLGLLWDSVLKRADDPIETFLDGSLDKRSVFTVQPDTVTDPDAEPLRGRRSPDPSIRYTWRSRLRLFLAQGRWNMKEHACVYVSSNVSFGFAFATDVIVEQTKFYEQEATWLYQILLVLSTQILGYSLAGICKEFLVKPSSMIWPGTLISTSMFSTLHSEQNRPADGWYISRWKFFVTVFLASFGFYFLPGLLFPALSYFNALTWFAPKNVVVANFFGVASGLGLFPVTFDWSQIAYTGSPLVTPFWAAMNVLGGLVFVMWILAPTLYYLNVFFSSYMPILSAQVFDNTGSGYDISRILTPDFLLDERAYKDYSRVFLPITYALSYAIQFASMTALLSHTACWYGQDIWRRLKHDVVQIRKSDIHKYQPIPGDTTSNASMASPQKINQDYNAIPRRPSLASANQLSSIEDVHNRLMKRYPEVPLVWYLATGLSTLVIGMFVVEYYPVHLPWWGLLIALAICVVLFLPIAIVNAITNLQVSIYLVSQIAAGAMFPGRGVANMIFVTYAYITSTQGLKFASDLKLGHYMKVPPRLLFNLQLVATIVSSLTQILVLNWMLAHIPNICTPDAINGFVCPMARVHFNGSVLWGVIGPGRFFGSGHLYQPLVWAFVIGAVAPVIVWYLAKRQKASGSGNFWSKVNLPIVFGSLSWIPPATGLNFSVWALVCFVFNFVIRRRKSEWWRKYNMTLSAALDAGVAFGVVVVFFAVVYPGFSKGFRWWGTEIYKQGCDWQACPYRKVPEGEHFGPDKWS